MSVNYKEGPKGSEEWLLCPNEGLSLAPRLLISFAPVCHVFLTIHILKPPSIP